MTNLEYFIEKYGRSDLLVDANLLVVLLVGSTDEEIINKVKPTRAYTIDDYRFLVKLIKHFRVVTTPHILTEVSNLCEKTEKHHKGRIMEQFSKTVIDLLEIPIPSREAVMTPIFRKLGLSDSIIFQLGKKGLIVLTEDFELYSYLIGNEITVANINHFRSDYILKKK